MSLSVFEPLQSTHAQTFEGFAEPMRKIDLASEETGTVAELMVDEGSVVSEGQPIAQLDSKLQAIQLEIAARLAQDHSRLIAVEEELKKRQTVRGKVQQLLSEGFANDAELIRADMELSILKARYKTTEEELAVRELERKRAEIQLQRRIIVAPFSGIITKLHAHQGEYISPFQPEIVSLAQVDQLMVKLNIPLSQLSTFRPGQAFNVQLASGRTVLATVTTIGVEINAESETVEVKLVIDNPHLEYKSGEKVTLAI